MVVQVPTGDSCANTENDSASSGNASRVDSLRIGIPPEDSWAFGVPLMGGPIALFIPHPYGGAPARGPGRFSVMKRTLPAGPGTS